MNTEQMDKKIIFKDESSYSVQESPVTGKSCDTCKFYFTVSFPDMPPCKDCSRCRNWESHIEEVKFDIDAVEFNTVPKGLHCSDCYWYDNDAAADRCRNPEPCFNFSQLQFASLQEPDRNKITATECIKSTKRAYAGEQLPDSGDRREFSTGSVRDVREGKGRYDLLSPIALKAYAKRMEDGMSKYGERNWEKGQPIMSYLDSAMRHIWNYIDDCMQGVVCEEDHLGASMWNVASCIHTIEMIRRGSLPNSLDDTPKPTFTVPAEEVMNNE